MLLLNNKCVGVVVVQNTVVVIQVCAVAEVLECCILCVAVAVAKRMLLLNDCIKLLLYNGECYY